MKKFAIAAVALTTLASSFAFATPTTEVVTKSVSVSYADLNTATPVGAKALHGRLQTAAWRACRGLSGSNAGARFGVSTCIRDAVSAAVKDVNKPALTALNERNAFEARVAAR